MKKVLLTSAIALAAFGAVQAVSADTTAGEANVQTLPEPRDAATTDFEKGFKELVEKENRGKEAAKKVETADNGDVTIKDINAYLAVQQSDKKPVVADRYVKVYDQDNKELKLDGKSVEVKYEKADRTTVEVKTKRGTYKLTVQVKEGKAKLLATPQLVASAEVQKDGWKKLENGSWQFLQKGEVVKAAWVKDNGTWYYLNAEGIMQTGWIKENGTWYYLNGSGAMQTGWVKDNGTWYYLQSSGAMATGWYQVGDKWYYSYASGALAVSTTTPDGYTVNANGEWV